MVSCAQGALGLLPFAVRLGDLRVAGVHLLATQHDVARKVAAPSREGQRSPVRLSSAGPGKGDTPDRGGRTVVGGLIRQATHDSTTQTEQHVSSTTQRR